MDSVHNVGRLEQWAFGPFGSTRCSQSGDVWWVFCQRVIGILLFCGHFGESTKSALSPDGQTWKELLNGNANGEYLNVSDCHMDCIEESGQMREEWSVWVKDGILRILIYFMSIFCGENVSEILAHLRCIFETLKRLSDLCSILIYHFVCVRWAHCWLPNVNSGQIDQYTGVIRLHLLKLKVKHFEFLFGNMSTLLTHRNKKEDTKNDKEWH